MLRRGVAAREEAWDLESATEFLSLLAEALQHGGISLNLPETAVLHGGIVSLHLRTDLRSGQAERVRLQIEDPGLRNRPGAQDPPHVLAERRAAAARGDADHLLASIKAQALASVRDPGEGTTVCKVVYEDGLATTLTVGQLEAMEGRREWLQDVRLLQSVVAFATPRIGIFPRQIEGADADEYASLADPDFPLHSVSESLAAFLDETLNRVHFPPFDARAAEETAKRALELAGVHHDRRVWHRVTRSVFEGADPTQARGAHTGEKGGEDNAEAEEAAETEAAAVQRAVEAAEKQHVVEVAYARKQSAVSRRRVASLVLMFQTDADSTLWCIGAREFVVATEPPSPRTLDRLTKAHEDAKVAAATALRVAADAALDASIADASSEHGDQPESARSTPRPSSPASGTSRPGSGRPGKESSSSSRRLTPEEAQQAADRAAHDLRTLINEASRRGVDVATSFEHFRGPAADEEEPSITPGDLQRGLRALGLALPPAVAMRLGRKFGRGPQGRIRLSDFARFAEGHEAEPGPPLASSTGAAPGSGDDGLARAASSSSLARARREAREEAESGGDSGGDELAPWARASSRRALRELKGAERRVAAREAAGKSAAEAKGERSGDAGAGGEAASEDRPLGERGQVLRALAPGEVGAEAVTRGEPGAGRGSLPKSVARRVTHDDGVAAVLRPVLVAREQRVAGDDPQAACTALYQLVLGRRHDLHIGWRALSRRRRRGRGGDRDPNDSESQGGGGSGVREVEEAEDEEAPEMTGPVRDAAAAAGPTASHIAGSRQLRERGLAPDEGDDWQRALDGVGGAAEDVLDTVSSGEKEVALPLVRAVAEVARVAVVALPGHPGTAWPAEAALSNELLGRVLARVLDAVFSDPAWEVEGLESAQLPWVLVGCGNGGTAAVAMLTSGTPLPHAPSLAPVMSTLASVVLVNAAAHVPPGLDRTLTRMLTLLRNDSSRSHAELVEHVLALCFSPQFLARVDREQLAREFFATRGALLESGDLRDPAAAEGASRAMQERMRVDATRGVPSLLAALTGMRHNADLRARGRRLCVPTALLQTHHNSLIMPSTARALSRALTGGSAAEKAAEAERERRRRSGVGPPGPPPIETDDLDTFVSRARDCGVGQEVPARGVHTEGAEAEEEGEEERLPFTTAEHPRTVLVLQSSGGHSAWVERAADVHRAVGHVLSGLAAPAFPLRTRRVSQARVQDEKEEEEGEEKVGKSEEEKEGGKEEEEEASRGEGRSDAAAMNQQGRRSARAGSQRGRQVQRKEPVALADMELSPLLRRLLGVNGGVPTLRALLRSRGMSDAGSKEDMVVRAEGLLEREAEALNKELAELREKGKAREAQLLAARKAAERARAFIRERERAEIAAEATGLRQEAALREAALREREERRLMADEERAMREVVAAERGERTRVHQHTRARQTVAQLRTERAREEALTRDEEKSRARSEAREGARLRVAARKAAQRRTGAGVLSGTASSEAFGSVSQDVQSLLDGAERLRQEVLKVRDAKHSAGRAYKVLLDGSQRLDAEIKALAGRERDLQRAYVAASHTVTRASGRTRELARREAKAVGEKRTEAAQRLSQAEAQRRTTAEEMEASAERVQAMALALEDRKNHVAEVAANVDRLLKEKRKALAAARKEETEVSDALSEKQGLHKGTKMRLAELRTELERVRDSTQRWTDSSIWQRGVLQRIRTDELRASLHREINRLQRVVDEAGADVPQLEKRLAEARLAADVEVAAVRTLQGERRRLAQCAELADRPPGDEEEEEKGGPMRAMQPSQPNEQAKQAKQPAARGPADDGRRRPPEEVKLLRLHAVVSKSRGTMTAEEVAWLASCQERGVRELPPYPAAAERVRRLPADERSTEERRWVAVDRLLHEDLYASTSAEDKEVMAFDEAYHTPLSVDEAHRLLHMPATLSEALGYLRSAQEVEAFLLVQQYEFGRGPAWEQRRDQVSNGFARLPAPNEVADRTQEAAAAAKPSVEAASDFTPDPAGGSKGAAGPVDAHAGPRGQRAAAGSSSDERKEDGGRGVSATAGPPASNQGLKGARKRASLPLATLLVHSLEQVPEALEVAKEAMLRTSQLAYLVQDHDVAQEALRARQYRFEVPADMVAVEIRVAVTYRGVFDARGYVAGRAGVSLLRIDRRRSPRRRAHPLEGAMTGSPGGAVGVGRVGFPVGDAASDGVEEQGRAASWDVLEEEEEEEEDEFVPIGWAPPGHVALCTGESLGRTAVVHQPLVLPVRPGTYEVHIGTPTSTIYGVEVTARLGRSVQGAVADSMESIRAKEKRLPEAEKEVGMLEEGVRLGVRKREVCERLIKAVEKRAVELETERARLQEVLADDDQLDMLTESQVVRMERKAAHLEKKVATAGKVLASRRSELEHVSAGVRDLESLLKARRTELEQLEKELRGMREHVPRAMAALLGQTGARFMTARDLARSDPLREGAKGEEWMQEALGETVPHLMSPAETVRHKPWLELTKQEKAWRKLDRILHPNKYRGRERRRGLKPKAGEPSKEQLEWALNAHMRDLTRREIKLRRTLKKISDQAPPKEEALRTTAERSQAKVAVAGEDDKAQGRRGKRSRGERARAKPSSQLKHEEQEWIALDRVLRPELYEEEGEEGGGAAGSIPRQDELKAKRQEDAHKERHAAAVEEARRRDERAERRKRAYFKKQRKRRAAVLARLRAQQAKREAIRKRGREKTATSGLPSLAEEEEEDEAEEQEGGAAPEAEKDDECEEDKQLGALEEEERGGEIGTSDPLRPRYTRDDLLRILSSAPGQLRSNQERRVRVLYQKYEPSEVQEPRMNARGYGDEGVGGEVMQAHREMMGDTQKPNATPDVDARARLLLRELDRANACTSETLDSRALHGARQRFPVAVLREELSQELDKVLAQQIVERERANDLDAESETEPSGGEESGSDEADGSGRQGGTQQRVGGLVALASGMDKAKPGAATGTAYCFACHTTPCSFKPYLDVHSAAQRRLQLEQEMQRLEALPEGVKWVESDVPLSVRHGGPRRQLRMDVVLELDKEQQRLGQQLRLHEVDQELHGVFASRAEYVEVLSLHGYAQMMWRLDAISALEGERSRLLARTAAVEVVDDVLEWMLEGWHFGERESSLPMLGFVPSVRPDGPIQVHHARSQQLVAAGRRRDQARKEEAGREAAAEAVAARSGGKTSALALLGAEEEEGAEAKAKGREVGGVFLPPPPGGSGDGQALVQRWAPLAAVANARAQVGQLAQRREERTALVDQTENTLKFGLFMLVFMFFRSMTLLRRDRESFGEREALASLMGRGQTGTMGGKERQRLEEEEENRKKRERAMELASRRASAGAARRAARLRQEASERRERMQEDARRRKVEWESATKLAAVYRGHLGRLRARGLAVEVAETQAQKGLRQGAASTLQRVWRGFMGRREADDRREELAEFVAQMQAEELAEEEMEYWENNTLARWKRNAGNLVRRVRQNPEATAAEFNVPSWYRQRQRKMAQYTSSSSEEEEDEDEDEDEDEEEEEGETSEEGSTEEGSEGEESSSEESSDEE